MWQQEWHTYTCSLNSSHVTTSLAYIHLQSKLKPCDNEPGKHTPAKTLSLRVTLTRPHTCSHPCWSSCPTPHPLAYPWRWSWCRRRPAASCRCCSSGCSTRAHNSPPASAQWGSSQAPELETNQFYMLFSCILLTALSFLTLLALIQTLCGCLGSKHQLTNCLTTPKLWSLSGENRPQLTTARHYTRQDSYDRQSASSLTLSLLLKMPALQIHFFNTTAIFHLNYLCSIFKTGDHAVLSFSCNISETGYSTILSLTCNISETGYSTILSLTCNISETGYNTILSLTCNISETGYSTILSLTCKISETGYSTIYYLLPVISLRQVTVLYYLLPVKSLRQVTVLYYLLPVDRIQYYTISYL